MKQPVVNPQTHKVCPMKAIFSVLYFLCFSTGMLAQEPKLNSFSPSQATVFIDFDGQYVNGSVWNWAGAINALPAAFNNTQIAEIHNRVAEDYRIFNLNTFDLCTR